MIIHVTKDDIEKGRLIAHEECGCPIWHAVVRELGIPEDKAEKLVSLLGFDQLRLGTTIFNLPPEAVSFQRILVEFPQATVEEISFVAPVHTYGCGPSEKDEADDAAPAEVPAEKPGLLERIFG